MTPQTWFSRWDSGKHFGFPIKRIQAICDLQVLPILPTMFWVNWHLGSGEVQNWFSRRRLWRPFCFPFQTILAILDLHDPYASYQVWSQLTFLFRRSSKQISNQFNFSYFLIYNWSIYFLTKFCNNWLFNSGGEVQNRLIRWRQWWPSWLSDWSKNSYLLINRTPMPPTKFWVK